jgi:hypothetical protein
MVITREVMIKTTYICWDKKEFNQRITNASVLTMMMSKGPLAQD